MQQSEAQVLYIQVSKQYIILSIEQHKNCIILNERKPIGTNED
jgi:hypothetical protein